MGADVALPVEDAEYVIDDIKAKAGEKVERDHEDEAI